MFATDQHNRFTRAAVARKPKGLVLQPLECLAFDTIVRQRDGVKRYILPSQNTRHFCLRTAHSKQCSCSKVTPGYRAALPDYSKAKAITDNGREFKGHFAKRMADQVVARTDQELMHWKPYPKTPKMNAHCEPFNRTSQESFLDYHEDLLFSDPCLFNKNVRLTCVYNTELPHLTTKPNPKETTSLTNMPVSPIEFLLKSHPQSRMCWTNTSN